jgi:hypothetical protein
MASHPYVNLPPKNFWRTAIAETHPSRWFELYPKKFEISKTTLIAAAGSCFAQYIGAELKRRKFRFGDFEPAPRLLPAEKNHEYGYGLFSARFGNVYTARQLLQLLNRAFGEYYPAIQAWETEGRFYDPFRPSIEPHGFSSLEELLAVRSYHLNRVRRMIERSEVFIFTLGLTEAWTNRQDGAVFPMCPGTIAGEFDPKLHEFVNFTYSQVIEDLKAVISIARGCNPAIKFLFTVSPVPLVATATDQHVLVATTYSKSVLRAVAGELYSEFDYVDYFPSYEIVTAPASRGAFYKKDMRSITPAGVKAVMSRFFAEHDVDSMSSEDPHFVLAASARGKGIDDIEAATMLVCDEEKLDVIAR